MAVMEQYACDNCGANDFIIEGAYKICSYCNTKKEIEQEILKQETTISLKNDIERLLEKCKEEPWNKKKYVNLILDIDPTNTSVYKLFQ